MEGKRNISLYRERLDRTLTSAELTNEETLKTLVKNQILRSLDNEKDGFSEHVLEKRTLEVSNFFDMLRSASTDGHGLSKNNENLCGEWKLKQDNEEFRVMYREGPEGTPFHTLLVEGYVDGPVDVCLCVGWESELYKKWWPQSSFPPFKITACKCLQKVRIGEQISLVRVKFAWPLSSREAVMHYFLFEHLQDDLIVTLFNTVSDVSSISKLTHGFTNDGIPEAKDVVRIDLVGGFALQKVTKERSYFRTIANTDLKLAFVPPSLVNFIARQLIGSGFRLYQKAVESVPGSDEDYGEALKDPLYAQIRKALYSAIESKKAMAREKSELEEHAIEVTEDDKSNGEGKSYCVDNTAEPSFKNVQDSEHTIGGMEDEKRNMEQKFSNDDNAGGLSNNVQDIMDGLGLGEIEEECEQENSFIAGGVELMNHPSTNEFGDQFNQSRKNHFCASPKVSQALETLERAISMVRKDRLERRSFSNVDPPDIANVMAEDLNSTATVVLSEGVVITEEPNKEVVGRTSNDSKNSTGIHDNRSAGSNSFPREVNHNRVAPLSLQRGISIGVDSEQVGVIGSVSRRALTNGTHENSVIDDGNSVKWRRKSLLCCFSPGSG